MNIKAEDLARLAADAEILVRDVPRLRWSFDGSAFEGHEVTPHAWYRCASLWLGPNTDGRLTYQPFCFGKVACDGTVPADEAARLVNARLDAFGTLDSFGTVAEGE